VPSPLAHLVALHGCRLLANMASDEHSRDKVARGSVAAVVHVMNFIPDDPILAMTASTTVYNFVNRQEKVHEVVVETGAIEALEKMYQNLSPEDFKERELVERALAALEPDGWRGIDLDRDADV
ncbi:unnamed protein product, partial [Discosporangium mesarthrocarpum]